MAESKPLKKRVTFAPSPTSVVPVALFPKPAADRRHSAPPDLLAGGECVSIVPAQPQPATPQEVVRRHSAPPKVVADPQEGGGCGQRSSNLDLLVRVVLQNEFERLKCDDDIKEAIAPVEKISKEVATTTAIREEPQGTIMPSPDSGMHRNDEWTTHFRALVEYKDAHGDINVPYSHVDAATGLELGKWVEVQRATMSKYDRGWRLAFGKRQQMQTLKRIDFMSHEEEALSLQRQKAAAEGLEGATLDEWDKSFLKYIVPKTGGKKKKVLCEESSSQETNDCNAQAADGDSKVSYTVNMSHLKTPEPERDAWIQQQRRQYRHLAALLDGGACSTGGDDVGDIYHKVQARVRLNLLKQFGIDLENGDAKN